MSTMAANEDEVKELKFWLFERVGDAGDAVVDDLQEEQFPRLDKEDGEGGGSEEYEKNVTEVAEAVARMSKDVKCKEGRLANPESKKAIHDGRSKCYYKGALDGDGFPHGEGILVYEDKSVFRGVFEHGAWNRTGVMSTEEEKIEGQWKLGLLEGEVKIQDKSVMSSLAKTKWNCFYSYCATYRYFGGWVEGYWSRGVPHGFQREFGPRDVGSTATGITEGRILKFVGRCHRGIRRGFCWKGLFGGGFLCGWVNKETRV